MTRTVVSGRNALTSRALETTQMSVQRPTSVISSSSSSASRASFSASSLEPKVGLSITTASFRAAAIFGCSSQPVVPLTQWTTGRFRPSWVSR